MNIRMNDYKEQRLCVMIFIFGAFLAFYLTGCSSGDKNNQFPIGLFDCVECQDTTIRYSDDGTLTVYRHGDKWFTGKWYVEENIFHTGDSWCFDKDKTPATYKWKFDSEILTLQVIEDECSDRVDSLDEKPWKLIEE